MCVQWLHMLPSYGVGAATETTGMTNALCAIQLTGHGCDACMWEDGVQPWPTAAQQALALHSRQPRGGRHAVLLQQHLPAAGSPSKGYTGSQQQGRLTEVCLMCPSACRAQGSARPGTAAAAARGHYGAPWQQQGSSGQLIRPGLARSKLMPMLSFFVIRL